MDEPTLDCAICGRPATMEIRDEMLNSAAEWQRTHAYVVCNAHLNSVRLTLSEMEHHQRVILQRCG